MIPRNQIKLTKKNVEKSWKNTQLKLESAAQRTVLFARIYSFMLFI